MEEGLEEVPGLAQGLALDRTQKFHSFYLAHRLTLRLPQSSPRGRGMGEEGGWRMADGGRGGVGKGSVERLDFRSEIGDYDNPEAWGKRIECVGKARGLRGDCVLNAGGKHGESVGKAWGKRPDCELFAA